MPKASSPAVSGERKFAVALFADLSGYTALCQRLDPEEVELTIAPQMSALRKAAEQAGGTIVNVAGDGFFAIFGVPTAQPDAASRAAASCVAMFELVATRNAQPGLAPIPEIHIGVAAGEVLVSPTNDWPGWSVLGSTVNLASRLCDAAAAGEALFDDSSHGLLTKSMPWANRRDLRIKGHDAPVAAWELDVSARAAVEDAPDVRFVGRMDAISTLDDAWLAVVRSGRSHVLCVSGETGIGKTRLLRHWLHENQDRHGVWVTGDSVIGTPLVKLIEILESETGESSRILTGRQTPADTSSGYRDDPLPILVAAARALLSDAAASFPLVVVIDDLRATDVTFANFLGQLAADPLDSAVLIVCTLRDDDEPLLPSDIRLDALDSDATSELLTSAFGARLSHDVIGSLCDRVQGHPLLTLQTVAYLRETGIFDLGDGDARLRDPRAVELLPTSVRMFIAARIDQLPASDKAALQQLSCFGSEWSASLVTAVLGSPSTSAVARLEARGFIQRTPSGGWHFSHGLVQQVAYASMTRRDRGLLHQRQFALLGGDTDQVLRSYHALAWYEAVPTTDVEAVKSAADAALDSSLGLASMLFRTEAQAAHSAIGRAQSLLEDHWGVAPSVAAQLLTLDAQCLIELNRFDDALQAATRAIEVASPAHVDDSVRVRCMLSAGHALSRLRRYQSARQMLDQAAVLAEGTGDGSGEAQALRLMADTWRHSLFSRYISLTEAAYRAFDRCGDKVGAAECARHLAYLFSVSTPQLYERWSTIARASTEPNDIRARAWLAKSDALALGSRFEFEAADAAAREAIELGERSGARDVVNDALGSHLMFLGALGRPHDAVEVADQLLTLADRHQNVRLRTVAAAWAAPAFVRAGSLPRALEELATARSRLSEFGPAEESDVALGEGMVSRDRGFWNEALQAFVDGASAASGDYVLYSLGARIEEARARLAAATSPSAVDLARIRQECDDVGAPILASYAAALGDAAQLLSGQAAALTESTELACLEERAIRSDNAALRFELLNGDSSQSWQESRKLWQELGCTIWLARAQARCGDFDAASETLDLLDSPAEARAWALGEAAVSS